MKSFTIGATSNLLESNQCWQAISEKNSLNFLNYGDITSGLLSPNSTGLIIIIFFEDLIEKNLDDFSLIEKNNEVFFSLIKKRISISSDPIIICLASRAQTSAIKSSQNDTIIQKFHNELIKKFTAIRDASKTVYFINLDQVFYYNGSNSAFSDRNWYFGKCRLSIDGLNILVKSIASVIDRAANPAKKVLVLDCDNTIWGGVIGEDGLHGLVLGQDGLGQAFLDFQKECLRLSHEGVLLALASKNNEEDVWNVFENHPSMILKRTDIVSSRINWNEKSTNLREIAEELNLGLDSIVFWDDNPIERSKMQAVHTDVLTIEAPKSVIDWPYFVRNLDSFSKFQITSEDKSKLEQYKSRTNFISDYKQTNNINSYLSSINLTPSKVVICDTNISRAEQMCKKTNQFNIRTKRYSINELEFQNHDLNTDVFMVKLEDNYGDHGLIALVGLRYEAKNIVLIDTFLMSCRVLGRHLEAWVLNEILCLAKQRGCDHLLVDFIDSGKNQIAKDFLLSYGFIPIDENDSILDILKIELNYSIEANLYRMGDLEAVLPNIEIYNGVICES